MQPSNSMWFDSLENGRSWASLWSGYIRCGCGGIRTVEGKCPACGEPMPILEWTSVQMPDGTEYKVPPALVGGEGRYEDWVYLQMLEREWLRPITDADHFLSIAEGSRPSPRAIVVLVFWAYFATRIKRLIRETTMSLPKTVTKDLLQRYSSIGARLDRLYRVLFSTTYWTDLDDLGYSNVSQILKRVQECRNIFAHGHPEAIDDSLVEELVAGLRDEHESWIAVFNRRISGSQK